MSMRTKKNYLTPNKVAEMLMVSPSAIRLWTEKGDLKALMTAGGHRRFKLADIKQFAKDKNIQLNIESDYIYRVLIVDDEPLFADYLKTVLSLECEKLEIEISLNGFDAGIKLKEFKPNIVLLDLMMPEMNGFQVCEQIKNDPLLQHTRVIAMSGSQDLVDKQRIISVGAETCLDKPIKVTELVEQLNLEIYQ